MNNNALEIHSLKKTFTDFGLDDISFSLPTGFIMGLVGKNGAGKTTTIKLILNLLQKESGLIKVFGNDISNRYDFKQDIAVVFDDLLFVEDWKIDDVEKAISPFYDKWNTAKFQSNIERFHLNRNKKIRDFSKGMKLKLSLAVALSHQAKLLILDEPTSGLDPLMQNEFIQLVLEQKAKGCTIFLSSHIFEEVERTCDRVAILRKGKIASIQPIDTLRHQQSREFHFSFSSQEGATAFYQKMGGTLQEKTVILLAGKEQLPSILQMASSLNICDLSTKSQSLEDTFLAFYGEEQK